MFGELLPAEEMDKAMLFLATADAILVVGSTVSVWPASNIVMSGASRSIPIVIINQGPTEADDHAAVKLDSAIGVVLPELVDRILAG
jgi:NAD-dependent SIR2 family protein deacetylase